jgi:hypothetical protein
MYQRDTLLKDLRTQVLEVHFTKANGENRIMRCTLLKNMMPESYQNSLEEQTKEKTFHKENLDVIAVWDLGENGWRSFRIDSVFYCEAKTAY